MAMEKESEAYANRDKAEALGNVEIGKSTWQYRNRQNAVVRDVKNRLEINCLQLQLVDY